MTVPSVLMLGLIVGVTPPLVVMKLPSGLILGFVVGLTVCGVVIEVPSGLILGFVVGLTPCGVVIVVPSGLILGFTVGLIVVVLGLVPGPPGPNIGDVGVFEEDGEFEEEGELEEAGCEELLSPPPHPVIAKKMHRKGRRVGNQLAMTPSGIR